MSLYKQKSFKAYNSLELNNNQLNKINNNIQY